jgi:hypothetical protein
VKKSGRKLIDSVSRVLATPGNDQFCVSGRNRSRGSACTKLKFNFDKPAPESTPASRKQMITRLTAAMSAISVQNEERSIVALSPLTVPTYESSDAEVQQLLSARSASPIHVGLTVRNSAFSRLEPNNNRISSPITVSPSKKNICRDAKDPLGRTLKFQTEVQSKDAIRAFCSSNAATKKVGEHSILDDTSVFEMDDDEAVRFCLRYAYICFLHVYHLLILGSHCQYVYISVISIGPSPSYIYVMFI